MSISVPSATQALQFQQQQTSPAQSNNWQTVLSSVSGTLGLSSSALQQQLQSGQSLSSIAQTQNVSQQTLVQSISTALTQNGSTATASQLQTLATNIANRTHSSGGHHHHHGGGGGANSTSSTDQASALSTFLAALAAQSTSTSSTSSGSGTSTGTGSDSTSTDRAQTVLQGLSVYA